MTALNRNQAQKIVEMLDIFPVVGVIGSRQVGKTTLLQNMFADWRYLDLEQPADLAYLKHDPNFFFKRNPKNIIIDESQVYPPLFNILRGVVDSNRQQKGRFILTSSS